MSATEPEAAKPFEPILTERLVIRAPVKDDLSALAARRNDPAVAKFQDWEIPYSLEQSATRLNGSIAQGGLAPDTWWMTTITLRDGTVIGDLPINISWGWRAAEVGYSFTPEFWGKGYAVEALGAVLAHLFNDLDVQRVAASLHPDNVASAMLLERAGFTFEGQTKLSFWVGDDNTDNAFYGVTRSDWLAWNARPAGPPAEVTLVDITSENQREVSELATHRSQERLVAPVLESYADALFCARPDGRVIEPRMWAIEADGELAGFMMIAEHNAHNPEPYLWRLLIDRRFQRRGIGSKAVEQLEQYCRSNGEPSIRVSWLEGRGSPAPFYLARGYVPTGEEPDGEVEARKQL